MKQQNISIIKPQNTQYINYFKNKTNELTKSSLFSAGFSARTSKGKIGVEYASYKKKQLIKLQAHTILIFKQTRFNFETLFMVVSQTWRTAFVGMRKVTTAGAP